MIDLLPSRLRPLTLLAAVLVGQVLLLAFQIRRSGSEVRLLREWTVMIITPFQRATTWVHDGVRGTWGSYIDLRHARQENEQLRAELHQLKMRSAQLESQAAEAQRLTAMLGFRNAHPEVDMVIARVIGTGAAGVTRTVFINRGQRDGITKNMGVITPDGVVGKVLDVYGENSQILLITDKESGVGALLGAKRTQGVVRGTGDPQPTLDYIVNDEQVADGETVLTSGQDRIFPKDLPLGVVAEVKAGNPFKQIRVRPSARLDRLEEVLVLKNRNELTTAPIPSASGDGAKSSTPAPQPPVTQPPSSQAPAKQQ